MVFVLLVIADSRRGVRLREGLTAQGWWATLVTDREGALRAAADHEPKVVVIDEMVPGATELVKIFSSRNGGPGALALASPRGQLESFALVEAGADEVLSDDPSIESLVKAVQRVAAIPHRSGSRATHLEGRQLTADEIFGDILAEVENGTGGGQVDPVPTTQPEPPTSPEASGDASAWNIEESQPEEEVEITAPGLEETPTEFVGFDQDYPELPIPVADVETQDEPPAEEAKPSGHHATDRHFGQYRLEERIAVGGMAEVWRASMEGLEGFRKTVAIKKILPHLAENDEFVAMFVDEAKLAAQLNHENLVDIYDLGKIGDEFFIAMEYVDGRDLRSILNRVKRRSESFPLGLACFVADRVAAALDYAHGRSDEDGTPLGLVHRDVSPRNILISNEGNIRLCDFGVAKAVSSVAQTEIGALKGKIQYMSPEQARGERVDGRSDIFSLGSVLFEMVTGRRLFVEDNEVSLLEAVRSGKVDEPRSVRPNIPEDIGAIILQALSKAPEERYPTAGEMQAELEEALFKLEPKSNQAALAEWMHEVFEEAQAASAQGPEDQEEAGRAVTSAASDGQVDVRVAEGIEEVQAGERDDTADVETDAGVAPRSVLWKFWLGVAAGLVLAVLLAWALDFWLG